MKKKLNNQQKNAPENLDAMRIKKYIRSGKPVNTLKEQTADGYKPEGKYKSRRAEDDTSGNYNSHLVGQRIDGWYLGTAIFFWICFAIFLSENYYSKNNLASFGEILLALSAVIFTKLSFEEVWE